MSGPHRLSIAASLVCAACLTSPAAPGGRVDAGGQGDIVVPVLSCTVIIHDEFEGHNEALWGYWEIGSPTPSFDQAFAVELAPDESAGIYSNVRFPIGAGLRIEARELAPSPLSHSGSVSFNAGLDDSTFYSINREGGELLIEDNGETTSLGVFEPARHLVRGALLHEGTIYWYTSTDDALVKFHATSQLVSGDVQIELKGGHHGTSPATLAFDAITVFDCQ
jgi:hypothetical protein